MARQFDPPLTYAEINRVYEFTTHVLTALGMPQWRMQISDRPCAAKAYATIEPMDLVAVGQLALAANWEALDVEATRIPTLIHECLHLTHRDLTMFWADDCPQWMGYRAQQMLDSQWERGIERWVDHMTQVLLGHLPWEDWAEEVWGPDWKTIGSTRG